MSDADQVHDQWDDIEDASELFDCLSDAFQVAEDHGGSRLGRYLEVHVVPCVPSEAIPAGARISGMKIATIDGGLGIYLFAENEA